MADETSFDFLHSEIVNYSLEQNELKNKDGKVRYLEYSNYYCSVS